MYYTEKQKEIKKTLNQGKIELRTAYTYVKGTDISLFDQKGTL